MSLEGKVALVTGASRGIGHAIAAGAGEAGREGRRHRHHARRARRTSRGIGKVARTCATPRSATRWSRRCRRSSATSLILVNNAGITRDNLALRMKDADWDEVIETNLRAVFRLSRAVMRGMMKARWGRIINITSVVGASGNPGQANYAAAKAGVVGMTKSLARELGSRNITVNCVAPGFIDTDMTRALPDEQRKALLDADPARAPRHGRRTSPRRSPTSRRPAAATSPARSCTSTAACICRKIRPLLAP